MFFYHKIKNAVTILISADFLKIDRLVKECLEFFVENIEDISKVQVCTKTEQRVT